jgi:hypothetical protein
MGSVAFGLHFLGTALHDLVTLLPKLMVCCRVDWLAIGSVT